MPSRGNARMAIESIARLQRVLHDLALVPRKVAAMAAPRLTRPLQAQFRAGKDPYGNNWAPLKPSTLKTGRRPPPLTGFTRELRDGTKAVQGRAGVRLHVGARYGYFHQVGFRAGKTRVPPRRILPQFGLPKEWRIILVRSAREAARAAMGR